MSGQLKVQNKNADALCQAMFSETVTQIQSLLGACNVYRRFEKDFAKRARPRTELTKNEVPPDRPPHTDA